MTSRLGGGREMGPRLEALPEVAIILYLIMEVFNFSVIQNNKRTIVHWFITINFLRAYVSFPFSFSHGHLIISACEG